MRSIFSVFLLLIFSLQICFGQNPLNPGFQMLETGKFSEAVIFFENHLKTDPDNPTALLCYGRGLGLSGKPDKALEIFNKLKKDSPESFEVDLNIAEAYMWGKDFQIAKSKYIILSKKDTASFSANLGLANAYSELQNYDSALVYVEKALLIQPTNGNALVSRKYMRLGKSSKLIGIGKLGEAEGYLIKILEENPKDLDAVINIGNLYGIMEQNQKAIERYQSLLEIPSKKVDSAIGIAQVKFKQKKLKEALSWAQKAVEFADSSEIVKAKVAKINALGWNKKFKQAFIEIDSLESNYPKNKEDIIATKGRLSIWSKGFKMGANYYLKLLEINPKSFEGNLGYADANYAMGLNNHSFDYVNKTLQIYPDQADAARFLDKLYSGHDPTIISNVFFSQDNGKNASKNYLLRLNLDPGPLTKTFLSYYQRDVFNINKKSENIAVNTFTVGASHRQNEILKYGGSFGIIQSANLKRFTAEVNTEWKLGKYQSAELNYREEIQTFNAELISKNLKQQNLNINYNLFLPSKIGLYSQVIYTKMSDQNTRSLIFSSLYYLVSDAPILKAGVNYGGFGFKNQVPTIYFSPDKFRNYELFLASENFNNPKAKLLYQGTLAAGYQKISIEKFQSIYRFDLKVGTKVTSRGMAMLYFLRSNSAASSVQGFTYNEWGINARYTINKHTF